MELAFFFFPHVSRAQRLAPARTRTRSSDSEPSALTTGLLNKAVALACLQYSSPRILKVAPCMVVHKFFRLDGLLLFYIIMGLRSVSSAITYSEPFLNLYRNSWFRLFYICILIQEFHFYIYQDNAFLLLCFPFFITHSEERYHMNHF